MSTADSQGAGTVGIVADDHELSGRARAYGEDVIRGEEWPLDGVDIGKVTWATSTRAKRRHGRCSYDGQGRVTITLTEHTYDRAGFGACETTIRHELVHAWQYQHRGERAVLTDDGIELQPECDTAAGECHSGHADTAPTNSEATLDRDAASDAEVFTVDTGHGDSFRAWVEPLDLPGRCSTYYERRRSDFAYVYGCPGCEKWWGKHRLCKSVRQAAHGGTGATGYRYCEECECLLHLQAGDHFLAHGDHDDETIRAFADGEFGAGEVGASDTQDGSSVEDDVLIHASEITPIQRPT